MHDSDQEYVERLEKLGFHFGLERIQALTEALGHPERAYRTIHVVGTNGKTSTARMIDALLSRFGLRTGRFTGLGKDILTQGQWVFVAAVGDETSLTLYLF